MREVQAQTPEYLQGVVREIGTAIHWQHELDPLGKRNHKPEAILDIRG